MLPLYLKISIFIITALVFALGPILMSELFAQRRKEKEKDVYECGSDPINENRVNFRVSYYLFVIVFIVFEVETIYFIPWAVSFKKIGALALIEMLIFLSVLVLALLYALKKDVFKWNQ